MTDRYPTLRDQHHFPFLGESAEALKRRFDEAIASGDLETASFVFLELRERRPKSAWVRKARPKFEEIGAPPIEWLGVAHAVARRFRTRAHGRANVYLVLLDTRDFAAGGWGVYVGETNKTPEKRYDQHRTGVNASRHVQRRGAGLLRMPARHLQGIERAEARRIEAELARALRERGIVVRGGH